MHPPREAIDLSNILHALGDPIRLAIILSLADGEARACCAALTQELPKSTLSNHFRVLRDAGLIHSRKEGVALMNTLRRDDVNAQFPGLLDAILENSRRIACPMDLAALRRAG